MPAAAPPVYTSYASWCNVATPRKEVREGRPHRKMRRASVRRDRNSNGKSLMRTENQPQSALATAPVLATCGLNRLSFARGANSIMALRCNRISGKFADYWESRAA
jgi:hypothetical protein